MENRWQDNAAKKLKHYFQLAFQKSGLTWDSDNDAEIDDLVDDLIRAVKQSIENDRDYDWKRR